MQAEVIGLVEHQFDKLLRHAQELKANHCVEINCYTPDKGFTGEEVFAIKTDDNNHSFPHRIYVLRLVIDRQHYFVFDCELVNKVSNRGVMIKIGDSFDPRIIINELFLNKGKLYEETLQNLRGKVAFFKHMNAVSSNWLKNALSNIR